MSPPPPGTGSGAAQRRYYRIESGLDTFLDVALLLADGTALPAELLDLSAGGVGLRWLATSTPVLDVGEAVVLRVQPCPTGHPMEVGATVCWMAIDEAGVRYGFEIGEIAAGAADMDPRLWSLFNRRRTPR